METAGFRNPIRSPFLRRDPTPPSEQARDAAQNYLRSIGRELAPPQPRAKPDPEVLRRIALAYAALREDASDDPAVHAAYLAFALETARQWEFIKDWLNVEFTSDDPYGPNSAAMFQDMRENHRLKIYTGGPPHPIMSKIIHPETGQNMNNIFRAVHDTFGHYREGNSFSESGEFNAYLDHSAMYGPQAKRALATETLGQNAAFNRSPQNEGKPNPEKAFPPQKADLLPEELIV
jgi:hypothetical protein